jgi:type I restriction enzyme, R subunit
MSTQSENTLEENLIAQLQSLNYQFITIDDEAQLLANLRVQVDAHNHVTVTDAEFERVLIHLRQSSPFASSQVLRQIMHLERDDGTHAYLEFINQQKWCQNQYQVTRQVTMDGAYKNRYDVTILINGLPLAQIELKRRGLELKEAFNQVNRYHKHSYGASAGLFLYIQLFVISNGVNTKYFANNKPGSGQKKMGFEQTFYWADEQNNLITQLDQFADAFLEPCQLSKIITKYIVLKQTSRVIMVLRPYQFYAAEAIVERVKNSDKNGYIWHTTGSGKTLTSFKASQLLTQLPQVHKVVFVVDRKDLDHQTSMEFNQFSQGSVDATDNTNSLVKQLAGDTPLIVTTIQKLNTAITKDRHITRVEHIRDKKIVFIFDECHRSQFGDTHKNITQFFSNAQMFGFTGTPIFAQNASKNELGKRTTKDLFDECLHKYVITDAIRDENVLRFSIEYIGKFVQRDTATQTDTTASSIDTEEVIMSPARTQKIVDYIIQNHDRKTSSREFTAMMCVSSVEALTQYYEVFRQKKQAGEHNLKVATIFSYGTNEDDKLADSDLGSGEILPAENETINQHSRDILESYISDYNAQYGTKYSTRDTHSFYDYYNNLSDRVKNKEVDILLVVNMFLTGFDSKTLNTLYVDKNLQYHGLIQAFSRTNRIYNAIKSQGNIVSFRNLKQNTDDAITLFSNKDAIETIITGPYEEYVEKFETILPQLLRIAPTVESVDSLPDEVAELNFVRAFRELLRIKNVLTTFSDFSFADISMSEQQFEDYKSKYLDIYHKTRSESQKVSILNDVDFELELIVRDDITVSYILSLLANIVESDPFAKEAQIKKIVDIIATNPNLRTKKELIEQFIEKNLPTIKNPNQLESVFEQFMQSEKSAALTQLSIDENIDLKKLDGMLSQYLFTERMPQRDTIIDSLKSRPRILERDSIIIRITTKFKKFVDTFLDGV